MMTKNLDSLQHYFDTIIKSYFARRAHHDDSLLSAIKYSSLNGGKRLRPLLVYTTGITLGLDKEQLDCAALACELIHCYSLVHDDLPAMDNDALRRGKPTCHIAFDEATAILAGDALQSLAVQVLLEDTSLSFQQRCDTTLSLVKACGIEGMVAGQSLDLHMLHSSSLTEEQLATIHRLKTGALINACITLPQIIASLTNLTHQSRFKAFGENLGLAFQIQDDYLDFYGDSVTLGKPQGSDNKEAKRTYTYFYDKENLETLYCHHYDKALRALNEIPYDTLLLKEITEYLKFRQQ
jgi:farnesyl diphosphate synthase